MPRTSCISHPENERLILIRKWQMEACGQDACAAALLNLFEYWHNIKLEQNSQSRTYNEVSERHGDKSTQVETLLQWHTSEELEASLLNIFNKKRVQNAIETLINLKFISVHRNPNPRYAFDKTRHFLFHPHAIRGWLNEYDLRDKKLSSECNFDEKNDTENTLTIANSSLVQNEMIDRVNLTQSISTNCTNERYKNTQPLMQIEPLVESNLPQQYTKITTINYLQIHTQTSLIQRSKKRHSLLMFFGRSGFLVRKKQLTSKERLLFFLV